MQFDNGKMVLIITIFFIGIVFSKTISKVILEMFSGSKKRKSGHKNFDNLVNREKQKLRSSSLGTPNSKSLNNKKTSKNINLKEYYLKSKISSDEQSKVVSLFSKLEWGGDQQVTIISKKIYELTSHQFAPDEMLFAIRFIIKKDLLLITKPHHLSMRDIQSLILNILFIQHLILYLKNKSSSFILDLCTKKKIKLNIYQKSFLSFLMECNDLKQEKTVENVLSKKYNLNNYNLDTKCIRYLFNHSKSKALTFHELFLKTNKNYIVFELIAPITPFSKGKESALKILSLKKEPRTKEELKKLYRSIILKRHPDQMTRNKIPDKYKQQITSNFQQIQSAYDFLIKTY